jgi:hypothetical protein
MTHVTMARPDASALLAQSRRRMQNHYEGKDIENASTPDWVYGCRRCKFGLINPPDANAVPAPLYLARMYQADHKRLTFCDCRAGQAYRNYLLGVYDAVKSGADHVPAATIEAITDVVTMPTVNGEWVTA